MTRVVAFTRVVSVVVGLFLGIGVASCSKSPSAPTPTPQPPVVVPVSPGDPAVTAVPSEFVSFFDKATGVELPLKARIIDTRPQPSVKIVGGYPSGCDEYSTNCFQWKLEVCTDSTVGPASVSVYLSPNPEDRGTGYGGFQVPTGPNCAVGEKMVTVTSTGGMAGISSFPTGINCCRYMVIEAWFTINGRIYEGQAVASFFVNYENRTP